MTAFLLQKVLSLRLKLSRVKKRTDTMAKALERMSLRLLTIIVIRKVTTLGIALS